MAAGELEREVARLRAVVARHEASEVTVAEQAIGLFLELRDRHGHDEETALARAVIEVDEGARAVDDTSRPDAEVRP